MKKKFNIKLILITLLVGISIFLLIKLSLYSYDKFYYQPQQLYNAINNNNYESIKSLKKSGMDINNYKYNISNSDNAFDEAFYLDNVEMTKRIIANNFDVDCKLSSGYNALYSATYLGDFQLCQMIINRGVDVYETDDNDLTVLDHAILNHSNSMIDYYLTNWFTLSSKNITTSLSRDNNGTGELTDISALETTRYLINKCIANGINTGLSDIYIYAFLGDSNKVIELSTKENIHNLSTTDQHMLSYICAAFCNIDTLKHLNKLDVDITFFNNHYIDTLRCAVRYNSIDVVKYLCKKTTNIDIRHAEKTIDDKIIKDTTPLDIAIARGDNELLSLFLEKGCTTSPETLKVYSNIYNIDILNYLAPIISSTDDETIETIINDCISTNNTSALDILLSNVKSSVLIDMVVGSNVSTKLSNNIIDILNKHKIDVNYEAILINAIKNHDMYVVKYAVSNLKTLDFGDSVDTIPIAVAITCGDMEIFDYLIDNCASLDIQYSINQSIRNLARETNYSKDVKKHIRNKTIQYEGFFGWF